MSDTLTSHCRLCAESKPHSKLVNLQIDEDRRRKMLYKLNRLSLEVNLNESDDAFPQTVCLPCIDLLDTAIDFIISVEKAQGVLSEVALSRNIKPELSDSEQFYDSCDKSVVKKEDGVSDPDVTDISSNILNNCLEDEGTERDTHTDSTPLSQLRLTWKDYSWMCAHCDTTFPSVDELREHSMQYHGCCNAYRCIDCNVRKLKLDKFVIHVKRHRNHLKLSCYKCHKEFDRRIDTLNHATVHLKSIYKCTGCNETYPNKSELIKHCEAYNKDKLRTGIPFYEESSNNLTCVLCKKKLKSKGGLKSHLLRHTERKRECTCDKCGKCFFTKYELKDHMLAHENYKPHKCEICKLNFRYQSRLKRHIEIHGGEKPFSCDLCGRRFRLEKLLKNHSIIHTDSLPYNCSYCQKAFRFKSILNQHLRQHTGVKPYSCQICQREFTNWPNYNKHMKRVHSMDMSKKKRTPDGVFPTNFLTGELIKNPDVKKALEWKKKMLTDTGKYRKQKVDKTFIEKKKKMANS